MSSTVNYSYTGLGYTGIRTHTGDREFESRRGGGVGSPRKLLGPPKKSLLGTCMLKTIERLSTIGTKGEPVHLNGHAKLLLVEMEMILDYELLCQPGMFPDEYVSTLLRWYGKYQLESILTFMGILGFSGAEPKQTLLQVRFGEIFLKCSRDLFLVTK